MREEKVLMNLKEYKREKANEKWKRYYIGGVSDYDYCAIDFGRHQFEFSSAEVMEF